MESEKTSTVGLEDTLALYEALNSWLRISQHIKLADEVDKWLADRLRTRIGDLKAALKSKAKQEQTP